MEFKIIDIGYESPLKKKILVVDDETALQTLVFDTLDDDYRILSAQNGREGIQKAHEFKPDLILMDIIMPDIGGYEAIRLLGDDAVTRLIPVIVFTAHDFDSSAVQLIQQEKNVKGFLMKPFRPKDLRQIVKNTLEREGG